MSDDFEPRDDLTERLSALGRQPVDPALQSEHLTALAGVARGASWRSMLASRAKLGAAVLGGFLIGTTGLASAGAMGPFQPIAKTTVEAVTPFELPDSASDKAEAAVAKAEAKRAAKAAKADDGDDDGDEAKEPKNWAGCNPAYGTRNRGQYLQAAKAVSAAEFKLARESDCGKDLDDDDDVTENETDKPGDDDGTDDQGKSADKRQDDDDANEDKSENRNKGKAVAPKAPSTDDADDTPDTPKAPEVEDKPGTPGTPDDSDGRSDTGRSGSSDSGSSDSGSSDSGSSDSGRSGRSDS